jgi:nucleoside-diphosphate-sugar epimerase
MRILITGASGCVGRYVTEALMASHHELVLAVRDAALLPEALRQAEGVEVIEADLRALAGLPAATEGIDAAVLLATAWGGDDTRAVTVGANVALADALIARGCRHILYFATASVLDQSGALLPAAAEFGSDYIKAKYALVEEMEARAARARITGLFPTLVFGGRREAPAIRFSHLANLAREVWPWLRLVRFFTAEGRFNVIHAADIATIVRHLVETGGEGLQNPARLVLGNPPVEVEEVLAEVLALSGRRHWKLLKLKPGLMTTLERITPLTLSDWDRYCARHPDQSHPRAVNPADFGLPVHMERLSEGLRSIGLGPAR